LNRQGSIAAIFLAQLVFGLVPPLIRFCQQEIDTNAVMFDRFCIGFLFFVVWDGFITFRRRSFGLSAPTELEVEKQNLSSISLLGLLCLASFFLSLSTVIWAWSLTQTSIANSTLLYSMLPLFTVLVGWLMLNQSFDRLFLIAMTVTMVGGFIIGLNDFQISLEKLQGDLIALLSALFRTGYLLTVETLRNHLNATTIMLRVSAICIILTLPLLFINQGKVFPYSTNGWLALMGLALTLVVGQGLMAYSLKQLSSGFVSLISCLDPIFGALFAWLFFSEALNVYNWIGFVIILLGVGLTSYSQSIIKGTELFDSNRVLDMVES
jgi:drug/metabolite transporter (DMT)-like permease